jgi:hypothetical protein
MKREIRFRSTVATAIAILILLGSTPTFARVKKEKTKDKSAQTTITRLLTWVNDRLVPPWPQPDPTTTTEGSTATSTDVIPATTT